MTKNINSKTGKKIQLANRKVGGNGNLPNCDRDREFLIRGPYLELDLGFDDFQERLQHFLTLMDNGLSKTSFQRKLDIDNIKKLHRDIDSHLRKYSSLWDCDYHNDDKSKPHPIYDKKSEEKLVWATSSSSSIVSQFERATEDFDRHATSPDYHNNNVNDFKETCDRVLKYIRQLDVIKIRIRQYEVLGWWRSYSIFNQDFKKAIGFSLGDGRPRNLPFNLVRVDVTPQQLTEHETMRGILFPNWFPKNWPDWLNWESDKYNNPEIKRKINDGNEDDSPWTKLDKIEKKLKETNIQDPFRRKLSSARAILQAKNLKFEILEQLYGGDAIYISKLNHSLRGWKRYYEKSKDKLGPDALKEAQEQIEVYEKLIKKIKEGTKQKVLTKTKWAEKTASDERGALYSFMIKNNMPQDKYNQLVSINRKLRNQEQKEITLDELKMMYHSNMSPNNYKPWLDLNRELKNEGKKEITPKELTILRQNNITPKKYIHLEEIKLKQREQGRKEMTLKQYKEKPRWRNWDKYIQDIDYENNAPQRAAEAAKREKEESRKKKEEEERRERERQNKKKENERDNQIIRGRLLLYMMKEEEREKERKGDLNADPYKNFTNDDIQKYGEDRNITDEDLMKYASKLGLTRLKFKKEEESGKKNEE